MSWSFRGALIPVFFAGAVATVLGADLVSKMEPSVQVTGAGGVCRAHWLEGAGPQQSEPTTRQGAVSAARALLRERSLLARDVSVQCLETGREPSYQPAI